MTTFSIRMGAAIGVVLLVLAIIISTPRHVGAQSPSVARGKYIVLNVAMCPTCHSPAPAQGEEARQLAGGPVPFRPAVPTNDWAETAPRLAGSPPGTDEQIVQLLMTEMFQRVYERAIGAETFIPPAELR